jgi:hypothetical protein
MSESPSSRDDTAPVRDGRPATARLRCPHCQNPVHLADGNGNIEEVLCPGCGSTFRVREARPTASVAAMRPLGKFQLLERVGVGAFGAVWKARDTTLDVRGPRGGRRHAPDHGRVVAALGPTWAGTAGPGTLAVGRVGHGAARAAARPPTPSGCAAPATARGPRRP